MPPAFSEENIKRLPAPIVDKLEGIIARIRRVLWLKGLWLTCAALLASLLAVMAIDAAFDIKSVVVRCALTSAGALAALVVAWKFLVLPLSRKVSLAAVARWVEVHHPEMQERISTAVELLSSDDPASLRGSEELLGEVVKSAVGDVATVSPEAEFSGAPARGPKRAALAALALLLAVLAVWPFHSGILLMRALVPFVDFGNAASFELRVISKELTVAEGDPLTLLVAAKGRADRVELHQQPASGGQTVERMLPEVSSQVEKGESAFAVHFPAARESFRYHVTAGAARTKEYHVTVLHRPEVTGLAVTFTYPAYTSLPPKTDIDSSGDIVALPGTTLDFTAGLNRPATSASLKYDQTENAGPPVSLAAESEKPSARWSITVDPNMNLRWGLLLKGAGDIDGRSREGAVRAAEDLPPAVVIDSPIDRELTLRPNEVLPLIYTAADDFGFSAVDLKVQIEGRGETLLPSPLPEKDHALAQTWHGKLAIDLSKLPLNGVNSLRVQLRVSDNLPPSLDGPQTAVSDQILIRLNWGAQSFAEQTVAKQEQQLRRELDKIKGDLHDERAKADQKMHQLRNREEMKPEHLEQLDKLTQKTAQTAEQLQHLAEKMQHSAFAERADALENAAEQMVKPAAKSLQQIPQSENALERAESARDARDQLSEAIKVAEKTLESFPQDHQQATQTAQLASLAQQEQKLADAAKDPAQPASGSQQPNIPETSQSPPTEEQVARTQREALERWQQQQQQIAGQTENLTRQLQGENPQGQQEQLQSLAQQAKQLADTAQKLAQKHEAIEGQSAPPDETENAPAPSAVDSPDVAGQTQALQAEADVAAAAGQLTEAIAEFQRNAGQVLTQNGAALDGVMEATRELQDAAQSGQEAVRELAQEASRAAESGQTAEKANKPQTSQQTAAKDTSPAPAITPSTAQSPGGEGPSSVQPSTDAAKSTDASQNGAQPSASEALAQTGESLEAAADALQTTVEALREQASGIGTELEALGEATQQTQSAARAGQQAQQAGREAGTKAAQAAATRGKNPELSSQQAANAANAQALAQNAAEPAQQAANSLALAAANAQHALGIPQEGLDSQNMGQHSKPTPGQSPSNQQAQNSQPNQPGNPSEQQALQTTKAYDVPPELAKLGLSRDDWARIRGLVQSGSDGGTGDKVPAEYRTLVKDYFRALSTPGEKKR
ncbi:MAG: hypothetical protein ACR2OZ_10155 [Verrucomicrobiales bacterium]